MDIPEFRHLYAKARDALEGGRDAWCVQSTGEKVAVALILNRADWLNSIEYTLAEALERTGPTWLELVPKIARLLCDEPAP
jgi:hypothetical protein